MGGWGGLRDDWNGGPTAVVPVVREGGGERTLPEVRWGFLPSYAKDLKQRPQPINARIETVATSGMFKRAFARSRCVVPALGYYEWVVTPTGKQPHWIHAPGAGLAMAGVLSAWADPSRDRDDPDRWLISMAIVTSDAHVAPGEVHDRMPACLTPDGAAAWLAEDADPEAALALLRHEADEVARTLQHHEVSRDANSVRNNGPGLIRPLPASA